MCFLCVLNVALLLPETAPRRSQMGRRNKTRSASFLIKTLQFFLPQICPGRLLENYSNFNFIAM